MIYIVYIELIMRTLILIIGCIGNFFIFQFFYNLNTNSQWRKNGRAERTITPYNIFIAHMAGVDLIACVTHEINIILQILPYPYYANISCKFLYFIPNVASDVSIMILFWISFHRHRVIRNPMSTLMNKHRRSCLLLAHMICLGSYAISIPSYIPFFNGHVIDTESCLCRLNRPTKTLWVLVTTNLYYGIVNVCVPIIGIVVFYVRIRLTLTKQWEFVRDHTSVSVKKSRLDGDSNNDNSDDEYNHNYIAMRTLRSLTILTLIMVGIPRLMTLGNYGLSLYDSSYRESDANYVARLFIYNTVFMTSAVNFLVYVRHVTEFKTYVISQLYSCFCCSFDGLDFSLFNKKTGVVAPVPSSVETNVV